MMKSPLLSGYIGGKARLCKRICALLPPGRLLVEPFFGAGWVGFNSALPCVANDFNRRLVEFYTALQSRHQEAWEFFHYNVVSRALFQHYRGEEGWRPFGYVFLCGQRNTATTPTFMITRRGSPHDRLNRFAEKLAAYSGELGRFTFTHMDFEACIESHDGPDTVFYIDPPYEGYEDYYGRGLFRRADFARLAKACARMRGRFLLSLSDTPYMRELFGGYHVRPVTVCYSLCSRNNAVRKGELLISNYDPASPENNGGLNVK